MEKGSSLGWREMYGFVGGLGVDCCVKAAILYHWETWMSTTKFAMVCESTTTAFVMELFPSMDSVAVVRRQRGKKFVLHTFDWWKTPVVTH